MTSKTSFFKSLHEDVRHRVWVPALACVVFLLGLILSTLTIQSLSLQAENPDSYQAARLLSEITCMYNYRNFMLTIVAVTGAIICGIQGFSYLSSKCQLDFYHSLPVKREKFFLIRWVNGILFYFVPALVFSLLSCIVLAAFGFMSTPVLLAVISGLFHNLLIFLLVYHCAILACMVTGNILVALGFLVILSFYSFMITRLVPTFMDVYYTTYASFSTGLSYYLNYLSPAWLIFKLFTAPTVSLYTFTVIFSAVLLVLILMLYRMRASEAAGKAIAFSRLRPVLRIMIIIPIALYVGLVFGQLAPGFSAFWSIFGLLVFLVLLHAILEVIFDFDIHSAFHHKKELIACAVFSVAFMSIFLTDVLKLDEQIPSQHSVEAVYMDLPIDNDMNYTDLKTGNYIAITDYRENHAILSGDDLDKAYNLLAYRTAVQQPEAEAVVDEYSTADDYYDILNLNVRFVKTNGQSEYRNFLIVLKNAESALADVFNTASFKQGHYQIFDAACDDAFTTFTVTDATDHMMVRTTTGTNLFTAKETKECIDVLRNDISAFTYEQMTSEIPIGQVSFSAGEGSRVALQAYIYPSFTETIRWMEEHGIDFDAWKQKEMISLYISLNNKEDIQEYDASMLDEYFPGLAASTEDKIAAQSEVMLTDPKAIASILPYLYNEQYATRTQFNQAYADVHNATTTLTWKEGDDLYECYFVIDKACDLSAYLKGAEE